MARNYPDGTKRLPPAESPLAEYRIFTIFAAPNTLRTAIFLFTPNHSRSLHAILGVCMHACGSMTSVPHHLARQKHGRSGSLPQNIQMALALRTEVFALSGESIIFNLPFLIYEYAVRFIDEKHSVQMVALVLENDCGKTFDGIPAKAEIRGIAI